jgi:hypothetical protein
MSYSYRSASKGLSAAVFLDGRRQNAKLRATAVLTARPAASLSNTKGNPAAVLTRRDKVQDRPAPRMLPATASVAASNKT